MTSIKCIIYEKETCWPLSYWLITIISFVVKTTSSDIDVCKLSKTKLFFIRYFIGHIAFSALDDTSHSVHVYNINGTSLGSKYVSGRVTGLTTASEYLVVADDAGDITMSRLNGWVHIFIKLI